MSGSLVILSSLLCELPISCWLAAHAALELLSCACRTAIAHIDSVIHEAEQLLQSDPESSLDDDDAVDSGVDTSDEGIDIVRHLFTRSEGFRSKINAEHMQEAYAEVTFNGNQSAEASHGGKAPT